MSRVYFRLYQFCLKLFVLLYPFPRPKLFIGNQGLQQCLQGVSNSSYIFIVTDKVISELGLLSSITNTCERLGIK